MSKQSIGAAAIECGRRMQRFGLQVASARWMLPFAALFAVSSAVRVLGWSRTGVMFNDGPIFIGLAKLIRD